MRGAALENVFNRQWERRYPMRHHPVQAALMGAVDRGIRFPLVPAGRRSGKTELAKRFLTSRVMEHPGQYFAAAPTREQAKKIWWQDLKDLTLSVAHKRRPNESELIIYPDGSELHVIGLDRPERFEGVPWLGGIVDEIANTKSTAVAENIMPALNTVDPRRPDYRAWTWFIGVPDGLNHYHDMVLSASGNPDFEVFTWHSADILPPDVIASARASMSPRQFRQEYEATFEGASGRIYEDYSDANHTTETIQPHERLLWAHDFNFTPMSSAILVKRGRQYFALDEIILESATARQSALEFVERYREHANKSVVVYGDPAGKAGEKHGHRSDYTDIEDVLRRAGWQVHRNVASAAPPIKDRQNALRSLVMTADGQRSLFVNPKNARWCNMALLTTQVLPGSSYQEDQRNKYQHVSTALGYLAHIERNQTGGGFVQGMI